VFHLNEGMDGSTLSKSEYIQEMSVIDGLSCLMTLRDIGAHIMRGDISVVTNSFEKRIRIIKRKIERKAGKSRIKATIKFNEKQKLLYEEKDKVIYNLSHKMEQQTMHIYTPDEIQSFVNCVDKAIDRFCGQNGLKSKQKLQMIRRAKHMLEKGEYVGLPYGAYDSVADKTPSGTWGRTLVKPVAMNL
jgi:hypothetical protein